MCVSRATGRYLDRSDNENELKQVLGELISAHDIGDDDVLILGRDGALSALQRN